MNGQTAQTQAGYGNGYSSFYCVNYYIDKHGVTPLQIVGLLGMAVFGAAGMYENAVRAGRR